MSDRPYSSENPWSNNPNAPQIPYQIYFSEKANFAGILIGAIFYGIVVVLFFQCMIALLHPTNRANGGTRWELVAHTAATFTFVTIYTAMTLHIQSISYIDNREFPGTNDVLAPGPLGYQDSISSRAISIVPDLMSLLSQWLADSLMLYRCYVIYAMNFWSITIQFLMYLTSLSMGIVFIYLTSQLTESNTQNIVITRTSATIYYSASLSLNVLVTFMIIARLILHRKNVLNATGTRAGISRWCKAVITVLVESSALHTTSFLLFIGPWRAGSPARFLFYQILVESQVIAPFLVTLRVANRKALTSDVVAPGSVGLIRFVSRESKSSSGDETLSDENPTSSVNASEKTPDESCVDVRTTLGEVPV